MTDDEEEVVIVGAGITGLAIAHQLRHSRPSLRLSILARDLPCDLPYSQAYGSVWAGADWSAFASAGSREATWERQTYNDWLKRIQEVSPEILALVDVEKHVEKDDEGKWCKPWWSEVVKDFTVHSGQEGGPGVLRFKSFCLDAPAYINYLFDKLVNADSLSSSDGRVKVHRSDVSSLLSVQELHPKAKVIINAAGLGAHKLVPNGDASCQLIRGQTLIVQLPIGVEPKIFTGVNSFSSTVAKQAGQDVAHQLSYIIPRARSGMVILGGTYEPGRLVMEEDVNQSARILKDSAKLWPDLIPPLQATVENDSQKEGWERIKVLKVNVGFRPGRSAGPRVELVQVPGAIALLHVYGLGGAGYQRGVGVASAVDEQLDIVMETQRGHT